MIINLSRCLTLSVSVVALSAIPVEAAYLNHDTRLSKSSMIDTNTHTYKSESQSSAFIKTAAVCFVTDMEDCKGMKFEGPDNPYYPDPEKRCDKEGYFKTSCEPLWEPYNYCPYDKKYWEKCICKSTLISCNAPNIGVGPACDGKYEKCCKNECPAGYDLSNGSCRQASSLKTACGNACYKILSNTCSSGSLTPPAETGGNRNKIVATTECGNSCWQSFSDNCSSGYVKDKVAGKCYDTNVTYTDFGSACYKEISCCNDTCSGYRTIPTSSQCPYSYTTATTGCGNKCYSCKPCPSNCLGGSSLSGSGPSFGGDGCGKICYCPNANYEIRSGSCQIKIKNGVIDGIFYCNDTPFGVQPSGVGFIILYQSTSEKTYIQARDFCSNFNYCGKSGRLPSKDELVVMYNNKNAINSLLGGQAMNNYPYCSRASYSRGDGIYYEYHTVSMSNGAVVNLIYNGGGGIHYARCVF